MNNINPIISIIVPVYNIEKYIKKCIESILNQSFKKYELILVDDGSKDESGKICDEFARKDSRIRVIHKVNGGLSDARNAGIDAARGEYIGFVDGDDYIEYDMYEELYKSIRTNNTKLSMCGRYNVSETYCKESFTLSNPKVMNTEEAFRGLLTWTNLDSSSCDKLFSRYLFEDIRFPVGKLNEDVYVMYKIIYLAGRISHIGSPKYYYVERNGSITSLGFSERKLDWPIAAQQIAAFINNKYPSLYEETTYFYFKSLMNTIDLIVQCKEIQQYEKVYYEYCQKIQCEYKPIVSNNYISKKEQAKIKFLNLNNRAYLSIMRKYYLIKSKNRKAYI